ECRADVWYETLVRGDLSCPAPNLRLTRAGYFHTDGPRLLRRRDLLEPTAHAPWSSQVHAFALHTGPSTLDSSSMYGSQKSNAKASLNQ
ncbi:hypothetical protein DNTS_023650, partial [Danionella cerebrum]